MDADQTIALTFHQLDVVLGQALDLVPVTWPHQLLELLPDCSDPAKRLIFAELIKLDMAKAAEMGLDRGLAYYSECFAAHFPGEQWPLDLVLEEIQLRRLRGDTVVANEYKDRFPHLSEVLDDVLTRVSITPSRRPLERAPSFETGTQVDDFTILRSLGQGGFANVFLARQNSMHRLVALKVSHQSSDEPIALSQLDHPNIVRVYDQRQLTNPPMILLYMQYVPGGTLSDCIAKTAAVDSGMLDGRAYLRAIDDALLAAGQQTPEGSPIREAIAGMDWAQLVAWVGVQLAEGLSAAHRVGIMHRDVKPANVLISSEGVPRLADFNVSYTAVPGCAGAAVYFGGSLGYMSPEQLEIADPACSRSAAELDERSDLYSLAMVLWELWQGRRPVAADNVISSWHSAITQQRALRSKPLEIVRRFNTSAERVLERTLRSSLLLDRHRRPASAAQFAGRLRLALLADTARLYEPAMGSATERLRHWPVLLVTGILCFLPNGLAGFLNYLYNHHTIRTRFSDIESKFVNLSIAINLIAFPAGIAVLIYLASRVQSGLHLASRQRPASSSHIDAAWNLGHQAALVGGVLWLSAGLAFPIILHIWEPRFALSDAIEFFLSLAICGGIAWIYPFFGVSLLASEVYYPALVAPTMVDEQFEVRASRLQRRATVYLASAAAIPLVALALLSLRQISGQGIDDRVFLLTIVCLTAAALVFAFLAHQRLLRTVQHLGAGLG